MAADLKLRRGARDLVNDPRRTNSCRSASALTSAGIGFQRTELLHERSGASMKEKQYLALLRGINVGGNNIITMTALKACFEKLGLMDVATYIQSGNVLFRTAEKDLGRLTNTIEDTLSKQFSYASRVVVVPHSELTHVVQRAPKGLGTNPARYRYDVVFLKPPLTADHAMKSIRTKTGVDQAFAGKGVLYFSRLIRKASRSHLTRIIQLPIYQSMTIRNWNTTTKLLALMDARAKNKYRPSD